MPPEQCQSPDEVDGQGLGCTICTPVEVDFCLEAHQGHLQTFKMCSVQQVTAQ